MPTARSSLPRYGGRGRRVGGAAACRDRHRAGELGRRGAHSGDRATLLVGRDLQRDACATVRGRLLQAVGQLRDLHRVVEVVPRVVVEVDDAAEVVLLDDLRGGVDAEVRLVLRVDLVGRLAVDPGHEQLADLLFEGQPVQGALRFGREGVHLPSLTGRCGARAGHGECARHRQHEYSARKNTSDAQGASQYPRGADGSVSARNAAREFLTRTSRLLESYSRTKGLSIGHADQSWPDFLRQSGTTRVAESAKKGRTPRACARDVLHRGQ